MKGVIFIGPQASGKSSFYLQEFYKTHIRLNMDMLKTRHREKLLVNACVASKQPCVIDNTNPRQVDRAGYIAAFKAYRFDVIGYYFKASIEDCLKRNSLRVGKECIPDIGIKATFKKLEVPTYSEGFDKLYSVSIEDGKFLIDELKNEIY